MSQTHRLKKLYAPVIQDFNQVTHFISTQLTSEASLIKEIDQHIFQAGGKRLRPLLVLLAAKACHYNQRDHIILAAIIEFLHTATLLHDDVVDLSSLRRGHATANALWGNASSILVGDFIYSRAFQLMVKMKNLNIMHVLANATNVIAEGEVMQLMHQKNTSFTQEQYMDVIYRKTAALFEASAQAAAVLANSSHLHQSALQHYGKYLGMAFQLTDDLLDYNGNSTLTGKNLGDDLKNGKMTLPLIYLITQGTTAQAALVKKAIQTEKCSLLDDVMQALHESQAFEYTLNQAKYYAKTADEMIQPLPHSVYKKTLQDLALFSVERTH